MFMLRCLQCGLSFSDLKHITIGMAYDIFTEKINDDFEYPVIATDEHIEAL